MNYDENKNLINMTFYFDNNEKSTVPASEIPLNIQQFYINEYRLHSNSARKDRIYMSHQSLDVLDDCLELNSPHLDEQLIRFETHKLFETALALLPSEQQSLIYDLYFRKISAVDLAKMQNVSKSAISHRHGRAKTALKKIIKQLDPSYNY